MRCDLILIIVKWFGKFGLLCLDLHSSSVLLFPAKVHDMWKIFHIFVRFLFLRN